MVAPHSRIASVRYAARAMPFDAKVVYWSAALANMVAALACAFAGVRRIRRGEVAAHKRAMKTAALLVVLFLISYLLKVEALGRETLALWAPRYVTVLRIHEACVGAMVVAGALALGLASRLGLERIGRKPAGERALGARLHRAAGWTAAAACALGVATASYVLYGMYERLG
jgi:uncharacterized membrane protein YozB (DUF420 family)